MTTGESPVAAGHGPLEPRSQTTRRPGGNALHADYPEGWLLIVLLPALVAGLLVGLSHRHETIEGERWWLLAGCGAAALEGILGGRLYGGRAAAIGAAVVAVGFVGGLLVAVFHLFRL